MNKCYYLNCRLEVPHCLSRPVQIIDYPSRCTCITRRNLPGLSLSMYPYKFNYPSRSTLAKKFPVSMYPYKLNYPSRCTHTNWITLLDCWSYWPSHSIHPLDKSDRGVSAYLCYQMEWYPTRRDEKVVSGRCRITCTLSNAIVSNFPKAVQDGQLPFAFWLHIDGSMLKVMISTIGQNWFKYIECVF